MLNPPPGICSHQVTTRSQGRIVFPGLESVGPGLSRSVSFLAHSNTKFESSTCQWNLSVTPSLSSCDFTNYDSVLKCLWLSYNMHSATKLSLAVWHRRHLSWDPLPKSRTWLQRTGCSSKRRDVSTVSGRWVWLLFPKACFWTVISDHTRKPMTSPP